MLTTLRIKNLALVADLTLELQPGYNAISGETGAGKSVLIGALNLVLGGRADRNLVRSGTDNCTVEAVFATGALEAWVGPFLETNGLEPCEGGQLVLKRSLTAGGNNRQYVNGSPSALATLAALGDRLVDIHGPHDHQSLLHPARQLEILDAFGGLAPQRAAFAALVRDRADVVARKTALIVDERTHERLLELLRYQVKEIGDARLCPGEDEVIERDHERARNAARLLEHVQRALSQLSDEEDSVLGRAGSLGRTLVELERLDPGTAEIVALHEQAVALLRDLQAELTRHGDRIDLDMARLQQLEERLNLVHSLKRKYGSTLDEVIAFGDRARQQLESLEGREVELNRLDDVSRRLDTELRRSGQELSARRRKLLVTLERAVMEELADLGFDRSRFEVVLESSLSEDASRAAEAPGTTGFDRVEFQFAPNAGEPSRPLRAIASSGEMARVMLGLKTVLAAQDEVPVLIFDEVDANVGGETAHVVGEKMREIGRRHQVLCITHLAPVAARADTHFVVTKEVRGDRTVTELRQVVGDDRVNELSRMLGGRHDVARQHAEVLLRPDLPARTAGSGRGRRKR
jgi:DNA repair protein RecN (Recombination protein N)